MAARHCLVEQHQFEITSQNSLSYSLLSINLHSILNSLYFHCKYIVSHVFFAEYVIGTISIPTAHPLQVIIINLRASPSPVHHPQSTTTSATPSSSTPLFTTQQ